MAGVARSGQGGPEDPGEDRLLQQDHHAPRGGHARAAGAGRPAQLQKRYQIQGTPAPCLRRAQQHVSVKSKGVDISRMCICVTLKML